MKHAHNMDLSQPSRSFDPPIKYHKRCRRDVTNIKERIRKMANWKALGPDGVHQDVCVNAGKNSISFAELYNKR